MTTMEPIRTGLAVLTVNDQELGHVANIRSCCFEVQAADGKVALRSNAIFTVDSHRVTLICQREGIREYFCPIHQPKNEGPFRGSGESLGRN
jgi:hypothetical protein